MKDLYGVHIPKPSFPGVEVVARTQNEPTNMFGTKYVTTRCTKILSSSNDPYISTTMFEWILTIEQLHTPIHLAMLLQQEPNWSIKPWSHGAKSTWPGPWAPPRCVLFWSSPQPFKKPTSPARKIAVTWLTYWPSDPLLFWNRTWWTWNLGFGMYHVFFFYNIFWLTAPPISDASQTTNGWWWCSLHRPSVCACIVYILYNYILNTHTHQYPQYKYCIYTEDIIASHWRFLVCYIRVPQVLPMSKPCAETSSANSTIFEFWQPDVKRVPAMVHHWNHHQVTSK